jgi:hypothetical protein
MNNLILFLGLGLLAALLIQVSADSRSPMLPLSDDDSFNFKLLVTLAQATNCGADINDVLEMGQKIIPSNFSSWNNSFYQLAAEPEFAASQLERCSKLNVRDTRFHAATYWRNVDYYLHGSWDDSWINETWARQQYNYDKAIA